MREFDLIARIRERATARDDVLLGIGDDCALLELPANRQLAITSDTLNAGVHFPPGTSPFDIGWKSLAVNLSDLAAMGAQPAWCTLALTLPEASAGFVDGFLDGFLELAGQHGVALIGGDTTAGPLSVSVTAHGFIEPGQALRRDGARADDDVWVSGTLGDAAGALAKWRNAEWIDPELRVRLDRPMPRVALGRALRGMASSCIDISDGLLADLGHVCRASGVGARIDAAALPASAGLIAGFDEQSRYRLQAAGGDDYELCFTAATGQRKRLAALAGTLALPLQRVGRIVAGAGVECAGVAPEASGYQHFDG